MKTKVFNSNRGWNIYSFQINREPTGSTVPQPDLSTLPKRFRLSPEFTIAVLETLLILLCFVAFAGHAPPDVNESHYLTKAKHFWNPAWCPGDLFLGSSFSHWLFYFCLGWPTQFVSLSTFAWIGRLTVWCLMAWAWRRLSWRLVAIPGISIFSALLFLILNDRFHLAGEWVVGGFEAKGLAYGFVLVAIGDLIVGQWKTTWLWLGIASAFHVLVGGWALLAAMFSYLYVEAVKESDSSKFPGPNWRRFGSAFREQATFLIVALVLVTLGAIPALLADYPSTSSEKATASLIYVNHRIAHHLNFDAFPTRHVARFVLLVGTWVILFRWSIRKWSTRRKRWQLLYYFGIGSLLISLGGLVLSGLGDSGEAGQIFAARWLRFYWFRLADFAIPASLALVIGMVAGTWLKLESYLPRKFCAGLTIALVLVAATLMIVQKKQDVRPVADQRSLPNYVDQPLRTQQTFSNWVNVCQWIANQTPTDAVFITPYEQQTFKWYAGRTEVVNWKDVPQDAAAILEWDRRVRDLLEPQQKFELGMMSYSDEQLQDLAQRYEADYLVVPQRQLELLTTPTRLRQIYPEREGQKSTFAVLAF